MKFIWEEKDIVPGRVYGRGDIDEKWMIGYLSFSGADERYVSISGEDGLVTKPDSKVGLAKMLTDNGYVPLEFM